jgi:MSHA biogenesis protein MshQ
VTRAYPAYFEVRAGAGREPPAYFYSYQPMDVSVTAKNALGVTTTRYDTTAGYSGPVQITIVDPSTPTAVGAPNAQSGSGLIPASAFVGGVATIKTVDSVPAPTTPTATTVYYAFTVAPTVPTNVTLRATETATTNTVGSANGAKYTLPKAAEAPIEIRSGRIRIGNVFGNSLSTLSLPVELEYYTSGKNWLRNKNETTRIPASAIGIVTKSNAGSTLAAPTNVSTPVTSPCCDVVFTAGAASIKLKPNGGTGYASVIFNLGVVAQNEGCVAGSPTTTGANLAWLRAPTVLCGATTPLADPVGRATFGVSNPDAKRTVHVREVFN